MRLPVAHIAEMAAYQLADLTPPKGKRLVSLSQNESLRPPAPSVADAIIKASALTHLYPDPNWTALREAIAVTHRINAAQVVCGNGSLDLIGALAQAYLEPARAVLAPANAYPFFRTATRLTGAAFHTAAEENLTVNVDALLSAVRSETRIVFVANPANPTGTRVPRSELLRLRAGLPNDVLLVIDEAYGEFADHLGEPMFDQVDLGNTVVLRTFSKAYGLAGLRVGWGLFPPEIAEHVRKLLNPNNVALPGQMGALAAVADQTYMRETCSHTAELRDNFIARMKTLGLHVPDSFTNFVLMQLPSEEHAQSLEQALRREGVFLRGQAGAGLPDCLRVTVGAPADMAMAADLIEGWTNRKDRK